MAADLSMDEGTNGIHVVPLGQHWDVETSAGNSIAHGTDKADAVEKAKEAAREAHLPVITLHSADGIPEVITVE